MKKTRITSINSILFLSLFSVNIYSADLTLIELYGLRDITALENMIKKEETTASTPEEKKRLGIAWHNLAAEEKSGASQNAVNILTPLTTELPEDYVVLSYLGSSQTMMGRDSWNPFTKMMAVNKGISLIDEAIKKDKDNVTTRLIRVYNSLALPSYLRRGGKVKDDLEYLVKLIKRKSTTVLTQSEIYFLMGNLLVREDKFDLAKASFKNSIDVDPENIWALKSKSALNN